LTSLFVTCFSIAKLHKPHVIPAQAGIQSATVKPSSCRGPVSYHSYLYKVHHFAEIGVIAATPFNQLGLSAAISSCVVVFQRLPVIADHIAKI
ncbi:MAG: hypothetical protein Q7V63_07410, partial [Gammaproteobacteria bacterium]|nr:hypothetical protein [Gammaproteobacteria bacterium]